MEMALDVEQQPRRDGILPVKSQHYPRQPRPDHIPHGGDQEDEEDSRPRPWLPGLELAKLRLRPDPEEEERVKNRVEEIVHLNDHHLRNPPVSRHENSGQKGAQNLVILDAERRKTADHDYVRHRENQVGALHRLPLRVLAVDPVHDQRRHLRRHNHLHHHERYHRYDGLDAAVVEPVEGVEDDETDADEEGGNEVGVDASGDDEPADVGLADLEVGDEAGEEGAGRAGDDDGEAEVEGHARRLRDIEEGREEGGQDEGGEDAGVGHLGLREVDLEEDVRVHLEADDEHVEHHGDLDDVLNGVADALRFRVLADHGQIAQEQPHLHAAEQIN